MEDLKPHQRNSWRFIYYTNEARNGGRDYHCYCCHMIVVIVIVVIVIVSNSDRCHLSSSCTFCWSMTSYTGERLGAIHVSFVQVLMCLCPQYLAAQQRRDRVITMLCNIFTGAWCIRVKFLQKQCSNLAAGKCLSEDNR